MFVLNLTEDERLCIETQHILELLGFEYYSVDNHITPSLLCVSGSTPSHLIGLQKTIASPRSAQRFANHVYKECDETVRFYNSNAVYSFLWDVLPLLYPKTNPTIHNRMITKARVIVDSARLQQDAQADLDLLLEQAREEKKVCVKANKHKLSAGAHKSKRK